jgi:hypothetical protein
VLFFKTLGEAGAIADTPEANCFSGYSDASLGEEILDITVAQVEFIVQPDCVGNDIWGKSVTFVCIHTPILSIWAS